MFGGQGATLVFGGQDCDQVYGNKGDDQVYGNKGDDQLFGGQDNDDLFGGQANDLIYGNKGRRPDLRQQGHDDTLFGGEGGDEFAFLSGDGQDTWPTSAGRHDRPAAGLNDSGIESFADLTITQNDAGDAVIEPRRRQQRHPPGRRRGRAVEAYFSFRLRVAAFRAAGIGPVGDERVDIAAGGVGRARFGVGDKAVTAADRDRWAQLPASKPQPPGDAKAGPRPSRRLRRRYCPNASLIA